jgi:hypothetical protein
MNLTQSILKVLLGILVVAMAACDPVAVTSDLEALSSQVQNDKELVESLVHDLKAPAPAPVQAVETPATATKGLAGDIQNAQDEYDDARAAQQAYLSALRVAVETGSKRADLSNIANNVDASAERFVQTAAALLQQRERGLVQSSRSSASGSRPAPLPTHGVIRCPRQAHALVMSIPKGLRSGVLDGLDRGRWRPWDQI